jgi:hypothetical protein
MGADEIQTHDRLVKSPAPWPMPQPIVTPAKSYHNNPFPFFEILNKNHVSWVVTDNPKTGMVKL